jgi:pilus assembly protein FimV
MATRDSGFRRHDRRTLPALGLIGVAVASLYHPCFALGLDDVEVAGRLGQPLDVNVPLHVTADEARYVEAHLVRVKTPVATVEDEATLDHNYRTQVVSDRRGRLAVQVTSRKGVIEPYVEFTVEVRSNQTRVQREFTVLLDPPGADFPQSAPATMVAAAPDIVERIAPKSAPKTGTTIVAAVLSDAAMQALARSAPAPQPQPRRSDPTVQVAIREDQPGVHVVNRGDSLYSIARTFARQHHLTPAQAVARLYQGNPDAFRGSPDRMLAGARISLTVLDDSAGMLASAKPAPARPAAPALTVARATPAAALVAAAAAKAAPSTTIARAAPVDFTPVPRTTSIPNAAPAPTDAAAFSFELLGSAQAAPAAKFGINTLKFDEQLHLTSLFNMAPPAQEHRRNQLPEGLLASALRAVGVTSLLWFGSVALLRRRREAKARR